MYIFYNVHLSYSERELCIFIFLSAESPMLDNRKKRATHKILMWVLGLPAQDVMPVLLFYFKYISTPSQVYFL